MSLHFPSNATFDLRTDLISPVSLDHCDPAPFAFNGTIGTMTIQHLKQQRAKHEDDTPDHGRSLLPPTLDAQTRPPSTTVLFPKLV